MKCPKCGEMCGRDEADVGVGIIYGPYGCYCGWSESPEYDVSEGPRLDSAGNEIDQWGGLTPPQIREADLR